MRLPPGRIGLDHAEQEATYLPRLADLDHGLAISDLSNVWEVVVVCGGFGSGGGGGDGSTSIGVVVVVVAVVGGGMC